MGHLAMGKFSLRKLYSMEEGFNKPSQSLKEEAGWEAHIGIFHQLFLIRRYNSSPLFLARGEKQLTKQR